MSQALTPATPRPDSRPLAQRDTDLQWDPALDPRPEWRRALSSDRARTLRRQLRPVFAAGLGLVATAVLGGYLVDTADPADLPDTVPAVARLEAMLAAARGPDDISIQYRELADEMYGTSGDAVADASGSAAPFVYAGSAQQRVTAAQCLATAAWYEAGDDPVGQRAVMQVILNRVRHPIFPNSICGVVFQGSELATGCQFTFTCDGSLRRRQPPASQWSRALALGQRALSGDVDSSVFQATHYHADYVRPWWSSQLQQVAQVGSHIFYRWNGQQLLTSSSRSGQELFPTAPYAERDGPTAVELSAGTTPGAATAGAADSAAAPPAPAAEVAGRQVVRLAAGTPAGRWAVDALGQCSGRSACQVLGYRTAAEVLRNRARGVADVERPEFLFVRDAASGREMGLWDCARNPRPDASQCLPTDQGALRQLLRAGLAD